MKNVLFAVVSLAIVAACAAQVSPAAQFLMHSPPDAGHWSHRISCGECTSVFGLLLDIGSNSTEQQLIMKHANATCDLLLDLWGGRALYHLCEKMGWDVIGKFLPFLWEELGSSKPGLAWDARAICSNFVPVCSNPCCSTPTLPEKLRLAFADASNFTRVAATWSTLHDTATHIVQWATGSNATAFPFSASGSSRTYAPFCLALRALFSRDADTPKAAGWATCTPPSWSCSPEPPTATVWATATVDGALCSPTTHFLQTWAASTARCGFYRWRIWLTTMPVITLCAAPPLPPTLSLFLHKHTH